MKKIISVIVVGVVLLVGIVALVDSSSDAPQTSAQKQEEEIKELQSKMLSDIDKKEYKQKVEDALKEYNVTSVSISTDSATGKPIVDVQLTGDILKENCNKTEVEGLCTKIQDKIKPISNLYNIELADKNHQLIATLNNDGKVEFK